MNNNKKSLPQLFGYEKFGYENRMVLVTSLIISLVAFDRLSTGYIGPYLVAAFGLSNTEVGALYSIQALAVAIAGYGLCMLSDATGWRKQLLVPMLVFAAICSLGVLWAQSFVMLMMVRLAMGVALGGISPVTQALMSTQSSDHRRGLNIGIQTLCMFLIAQLLGPLIHTRLADHWGWQASYLASGLPFLLLAVAVAVVLRGVTAPVIEKGSGAAKSVHPGGGIAAERPYNHRNVWLCVGISAFFMIGLVVHGTFLPLFLVQFRGFAPTEMGSTMSVLGLAGCVGGLGLPMLSDRIGRRATLVLAMVLATLVPLAALFWVGANWVLSLLLFLGSVSVGALPIFAVVVPGESVPASKVAATIALIVGTGEIVGGVGSPLLAGKLADHFGLATPFWLTLVAAAICFLLALAIRTDSANSPAAVQLQATPAGSAS